MERAFDQLDAAEFLAIWHHFDADDNGYIEGKELDEFFRHVMKRLGSQETTEENVQKLKQRFMSTYDVTADGKLQIQELALMILPADENFLLVFRREAPLDNSVDFMKIWRKYDVDCNGCISAQELKAFLRDLIQQHHKEVSPSKLDEYTDAMMKVFDKNKDGCLELNDMARILAMEDNFLLQFQLDASSQGERKRDFEKIFTHYDVNKTGELEGVEVDGFVKDMMELVRPSITAKELDKLKVILLGHCDVNRDGKIQKNELSLCLGVRPRP
ncbi:secretagogin [Gadus morhua]|uniref:secretagogin n=1 Tax=Gadus morhua TaxID=8049 RepID=UPI00023F21DF|nr:secretagogin-like [Gadus morhua]XP_056459162.1 secretagogin isoform X1 [Gadus chalcogrammus]XP_059921278.1 secretagogin-like isoform X1 [Gadus macrocephalus]